ncbi:MAG TPA: extracellular solute-binding protein [Acidimicrobiales bacterium]|nr:extracellular solute-binding protein [Acidimicrobiales bacterium]
MTNPLSMQSTRFRKFVVVAAAALSAVGVVTLSKGAGATSHPTLVVYSAQGYDKATVAAFNATHPGFTVTLNDNSTGPLLQQIQAEGNHPTWGVLWVDGATAFAQLDHEGLLAKHIVPKVSFNAVGKANIPADGSYVPTGLTATGALVYDSSQIKKAQLPKSWAQLTSSKFKGMLGMNDPTQSGPTYPMIAGIMNYLGHYKGHGSTAASVAAGKSYLSKLKANGLVINSTNGPTIAAIQAHTIAMAIIQSSAGYGTELSQSPSLRVAYLKPVTALPGVIGIDAKMPAAVRNEAQKFVNYVLSSAGQHAMKTGDPQGDSLFWPVLNGIKAANKILPPLSSVPMQTVNPAVWGALETPINNWFTANINNG